MTAISFFFLVPSDSVRERYFTVYTRRITYVISSFFSASLQCFGLIATRLVNERWSIFFSFFLFFFDISIFHERSRGRENRTTYVCVGVFLPTFEICGAITNTARSMATVRKVLTALDRSVAERRPATTRATRAYGVLHAPRRDGGFYNVLLMKNFIFVVFAFSETSRSR